MVEDNCCQLIPAQKPDQAQGVCSCETSIRLLDILYHTKGVHK